MLNDFGNEVHVINEVSMDLHLSTVGGQGLYQINSQNNVMFNSQFLLVYCLYFGMIIVILEILYFKIVIISVHKCEGYLHAD